MPFFLSYNTSPPGSRGRKHSQADALIAGASITQERKDRGWIFSDGYYTATQTIAVAANSDISSWEDLRRKNVAAKNGTMGCAYAESLQDK